MFSHDIFILKCFNVSGLGPNCKLEYKTEKTSNTEGEVCLINGNSGSLMLNCVEKCLTHQRITIHQNGVKFEKLFITGLDKPLLKMTPKKNLLVKEGAEYSVKNLLNIKLNPKVNQFLSRGKSISHHK